MAELAALADRLKALREELREFAEPATLKRRLNAGEKESPEGGTE